MYCTLSTSDTPDDNACRDRLNNGFYKLLFLYNRRRTLIIDTNSYILKPQCRFVYKQNCFFSSPFFLEGNRYM